MSQAPGDIRPRRSVLYMPAALSRSLFIVVSDEDGGGWGTLSRLSLIVFLALVIEDLVQINNFWRQILFWI